MARLIEDTFSRGFETARLLLTHPRFTSSLAAAIRRDGGVDRAIDALLEEFGLKTGETPSQQTARNIMGANMLGIPEVERHFGELTDEQRQALETIPFSKETLKGLALTHILVADVGCSLLDMQKRAHNAPLDEKDQYEEEFAKRTETACWRLIQKTYVEGSCRLYWDEQKALVDHQADEIPSARQVIYMMILYFLVREEPLFAKIHVRTSDVGPLDQHIYVGFRLHNNRRHITWGHYVRYRSDIGVASARKAA